MADKNIKLRLDYSEFSGGVSDCRQKMQMLTEQFKMQQAELGNNAEEIDKLSLAEDALNQKIHLQEQIVAQSMEKWEALVESEDATIKQMDRAESAYIKNKTVLLELRNQLADTEQALSELTDEEQRSVQMSGEAGTGFQNFADSLTSAVSTISSITGAFSAIATEIDQMARSAASSADDISTMAVQYGVAEETMESWVAIAGLTDVSAETLGSSMSKLTREMSSAANGSTASADKFKALGISVTDARGNLRNAEDVFYEVIDALGQMDSASERDAMAMDLLGRSAQQLNPIINMGSQAFKNMADSAQDIIPEAFLENLNDLSDALDMFDNSLQIGQNTLVGAFAPALTTVLNGFNSLSPAALGTIAAGKMMWDVFNALIPIMQLVKTAQLAGAAATISDATAKELDTAATVQTTGANMSFIASIMEVVTAFMPQILAITALVAALGLLAVGIAMIVDAFNQSKDAADEATESYERLTNTASRLSTPNFLGATTGHFASGSTTGGAGGLAWVGEQGAELVQLPYGSTVYNHQESKSMSSSSTNNYYVTIDAKNVNDFNKVVKVFSGLDQSMNRGGFVNG